MAFHINILYLDCNSYDCKGRAIAVTTKDYYYEKPKTKVTNIAWSPELLGFRSNYLPSQIITQSDYSEYVTNISYTLDRDGYIETCTMSTFEDGEHYETVIYTFKWQ